MMCGCFFPFLIFSENQEEKMFSENQGKNARERLMKVMMMMSGLVMGLFFVFLSTATAADNLEVNSMDAAGLVLEFNMPEFDIFTVQETDGQSYSIIEVPGWTKNSQKGHPALPFTGTLIQVPEGHGITADIMSAETDDTVFTPYDIRPVPEVSMSETGDVIYTFDKDPGVYNTDDDVPEFVLHTDAVQILRGVSVSRLRACPFAWNPGTRQLRCYRHMKIRINFIPLASAVASASQTGLSLKSITTGTRLSESDAGISPDSLLNTDLSIFKNLKKEVILNYAPMDTTSGPVVKTNSFLSKMAINEQPADQTAIKISISRTEIYRVSFDALASAGVSMDSINPACFKLFCAGTEVAMRVNTEDAWIEFYGEAIDNQYTGTNVYWLYWTPGDGKRMPSLNAEPPESGTVISTFTDERRFEQNTDFWAKTPSAQYVDYWYWEKLPAEPGTYSIDIPDPVNTQENAALEVYFQGRTTASPHPNHHTTIYLNDTVVGDNFWDNDIAYTQRMTLQQNLLADGNNILKIVCPNDTGAVTDVVYFNRAKLEYRRHLRAIQNELRFQIEQDNTACKLAVSGFTSEDICLYDITDPENPSVMTGFTTQAQDTIHTATFGADIFGIRTFIAIAANSLQNPDQIEKILPSDLKNTLNGADYIMITDTSMMSATASLGEFRKNAGLRVKSVAVSDIMNAFHYGVFDPGAIRDFLSYAYQHWTPPAPTYVVLIGDANIDYRNYYNTGKKNMAPVHLSYTTEIGLTPDDNWYVCMDGETDVLPDMCIGRIPAGDSASAAGIINKIIGYEQASAYIPDKVLLIADDEIQFETINDTIAADLPADFSTQKIYLRSYGSNINGATQAILSAINSGALLTSYVGHGSLKNWAGEYMFESSDINALNNAGKLTFVTALDCINGYFSQPYGYSIGQEFVRTADKGAIACFAPSGLGNPWEHEVLGTKIFDALFKDYTNIVGSITAQAKLNAYARGVSADTVKMFNLFGDPATRLKYYAPTYTIMASASDNGTISPAGTITVDTWSDQGFSITPDENYHIAGVAVDGHPVGVVSSYTFFDVSKNHTIVAEFAPVHTIIATAAENGAISPDGNVMVNDGNDQVFSITADANYLIASVEVDGKPVGAVASYTFFKILKNHTIAAEFIPIHTITATATENGHISPDGNVIVYDNKDQMFTITPNSNCHIVDVLVDGSPVGAVDSYTFFDVSENHSIHAEFIPVYIITASGAGNGTISPDGNVIVYENSDQTFIITPSGKYHIAGVDVDGSPVGAVGSHTFFDLSDSHTITAAFDIYPSAMYGDLNNDNIVNLTDAICALRMMVNLPVPAINREEALEENKIGPADAVFILQVAAQLID
jgi:hypothetical protein